MKDLSNLFSILTLKNELCNGISFKFFFFFTKGNLSYLLYCLTTSPCFIFGAKRQTCRLKCVKMGRRDFFLYLKDFWDLMVPFKSSRGALLENKFLA